jgi:Domain of unknown function (DUF5753)
LKSPFPQYCPLAVYSVVRTSNCSLEHDVDNSVRDVAHTTDGDHRVSRTPVGGQSQLRSLRPRTLIPRAARLAVQDLWYHDGHRPTQQQQHDQHDAAGSDSTTFTVAKQIRHLIDLADQPNITINVIPAKVVEHPGLTGQFVILDFAADPSVVHVEAKTTGLFLDEPDKVALYRLTVEKLTDLALDEQTSVRLLRSIASDLDRE